MSDNEEEYDYEKERLRNIEANKALLNSLDLGSDVLGITLPDPPKTIKASKATKPRVSRSSAARDPTYIPPSTRSTRSSVRLSGVKLEPLQLTEVQSSWDVKEKDRQINGRSNKTAKHQVWSLKAALSGDPAKYTAAHPDVLSKKRKRNSSSDSDDDKPLALKVGTMKEEDEIMTEVKVEEQIAELEEIKPKLDKIVKTELGSDDELKIRPADEIDADEDDVEEQEQLKQDYDSLSSLLTDISKDSYPRAENNAADHANADLQKSFKNIKLKAISKVTAERIYTIAAHPIASKDLLFVGDKQGQIGIWDASADNSDEDEKNDGRVYRTQFHARSSVSCVAVDYKNGHSLLSTAYDCTMRSFNFETGQSTELFASMLDADGGGRDKLFSQFTQTPDGSQIWISDNRGGVSRLDSRARKESRRWELSDKKIGSVSLDCSGSSHSLVTASNDRTIRIYDIRNLNTMPAETREASADLYWENDREEVVNYFDTHKVKVPESAHGMSVSSAYYSPCGKHILSTSYDNYIRVFNAVGPLKEMRKIKHDNQTGRYLTIFRAQWYQGSDVAPHFVCANLKKGADKQGVEVFHTSGKVIANLYDGNRITAVQAVTVCHPNQVGRVYTGNASGKCIIWSNA